MEHDSSLEAAVVFVASEIPNLVDINLASKERKKRRHQKSRLGCIACKQRRVKCDENFPCSNCARRKEKCVHLKTDYPGGIVLRPRRNPSNPGLDPASQDDTQINLLHMELFHHFETQLKDTLSFPQVWPLLLRQSFQEPYIMCTILSLAATHLSILRPGTPRYSRAALSLLTKSAQLFREQLSRPMTPENCDALMGTSILMQYLSWCNLSFLEDQRSSPCGLDLSQDQLFVLSAGVQHIFFEALPFFLRSRSVFISVAVYRPIVRMEDVVRQNGRNPEELVSLFMRLWDDPRYQDKDTPDGGAANSPSIPGESACCFQEIVPLYSSHPEFSDMLRAREVLRGTISSATTSHHPSPAASISHSATTAPYTPLFPRTPREAFERAARSLAIILTVSQLSAAGRAAAKQHDIERYFFSFPIVLGYLFSFPAILGGPLFSISRAADTRALVVLFHFYHSGRVLLTSPGSWWARERSQALEKLILQELRNRGLGVCLRNC